MTAPSISPLRLTAWTTTSAAGTGRAATWDSIAAQRSGLRRNDFPHCDLDTWIGRVDGVEDTAMPAGAEAFNCRNNQLAWLAYQQDGLPDAVAAARARYGAHRIAVFIGTSTAGIGHTEDAYRYRQADGSFDPRYANKPPHNPHTTGAFLAAALGLTGPCHTVSTACSSSAKVFADASRYLALGLADAALVGGVDSLCLSILYGFNALQLVSDQPCRPLDAARDGINLGEAGGYALLERADSHDATSPRLIGYGESSDAYHMSTPHPEGRGAAAAMRAALHSAGRERVDYLNLHGTGTRKNDSAECAAVASVFPGGVALSSTKAWMGHTLGAAGITEAAIALLAAQRGTVPGNLNLSELDPDIAPQAPDVRAANRPAALRTVQTNSFGFGGSNASLIFELAA